MSDVDDSTVPPVGGPSWARRSGPSAAPSVPDLPQAPPPPDPPAVPGGLVPPAPPAVGGPAAPWSGAGAPAGAVPSVVHTEALGVEAERIRPPKLSYSRHAVSPLPYGAVALGSIVALLIANRWATSGDTIDGRDSLTTLNQVWFTVTNLLLVQRDVRPLTGVTEATVVLVLAGVLVASMALWVARIGRNLPLGESSFGVGLALLALPAWWTFSLTAGTLDQSGESRIDALMRLCFAAVLLVAQFLLLRWALLNKVWRAGRIPGDLASIVLWIPEIIPWGLFLGSSIYTLAATEEGKPPPTGWQPTPAMLDWGFAMSRLCLAVILGLLVATSVLQHLGIGDDRKLDQAARNASRRNRFGPEAVTA